MSQHSALLEEGCACDGGCESETEYKLVGHDEFFTPPATPHDAPDFRSAIQLQFQMLQSYVIVQYEKDFALMKEEREHLRQRLLAYEGTSTMATLPQNDTVSLSEHLLAPKSESHTGFHKDEPATKCTTELSSKVGTSHGELSKRFFYELTEQQVALCFRGISEGGKSISHDVHHSGFTTSLDCLPVAPSSPRQHASSREPVAAQSEISPEVLSVTSVSPATTAPPATSEVRDMAGIAVNAIANLDSNPEDPAQERTPLLERKSAEIVQSELQEGTRGSPGCAQESIPTSCQPITSTSLDVKVSEEVHRQTSPMGHLGRMMSMKNSHVRKSMTKQLYSPDREKDHHEHHHALSLAQSEKLLIQEEEAVVSWFERIVASSHFDLVTGGLIVANALAFACSIEYDGFDCGHAVRPEEYGSAAESWPGASVAFLVLESIFSVLFLFELLARLIATGPRKSVRCPWMWFDFFVIALGLIDTFGAGALGINTSMIRLFRLVRLVKLLKIFQALEAFDSLFLLVKALHASVHAMTYSFVMIMILQVVVGMFMCQMLQPLCLDDDLDVKVRKDIFKFFGTFSRAMLSMFEITLANWVPCCRLLVEEVNQAWMLFFIFYRCMFCFALVKVISAVFITETNRVLASDDELFLMRQKRDRDSYTQKLSKMFHQIDLDGDGYLSWSELQQLLSDTASAEYLTTLGFQQHDFEKLFWLIDEGEGKIAISDFMSKVGKLKGMSKTIDMLTLLKLTHRIEVMVHNVLENAGLSKHGDALEEEEETELFTGRGILDS
mmetsp:Transcript_87344/g.159643  ORF Transcript_87344/g.159643 Transcript_87344/m.159643 type:complete len:782 (-) Transcript_87344:158-2503(-)